MKAFHSISKRSRVLSLQVMPMHLRKKFWMTNSTCILGRIQNLPKFKAKTPPTIFLFAFKDNNRPPRPANFEFSQKKELTKRIGALLESIRNVTVSKCEKLLGIYPNNNVFNIIHQPLCCILAPMKTDLMKYLPLSRIRSKK